MSLHNDFRDELVKLMPGFNWTVHQSSVPASYLEATGTQSAGFNRTATLRVVKTARVGVESYEVKSAGFGKRAPWGGTNYGPTLAKALRALQEQYKAQAIKYRTLENNLLAGRGKLNATSVPVRPEIELLDPAKLGAWRESLLKGIAFCNQNVNSGDAATLEDIIKYLQTLKAA